jgi:putative membrane protein
MDVTGLRRSTHLAWLCAAALSMVTATVPETSRAEEPSPSVEDRAFVRRAVEADQLAVVLARLAGEKGTSPSVRRFSEEVLTSHARADDALQELAAREGISLSDDPTGAISPKDERPRPSDVAHPTPAAEAGNAAPATPSDLDPNHSKVYRDLAALSGAELDAEYLRVMVGELERSAADFERAAKGATDPDVKGFAAQNLTSLDDQLRLAREARHALDTNAKRGAAQGEPALSPHVERGSTSSGAEPGAGPPGPGR